MSCFDCDTTKVLRAGKAERVRLTGVDCPEKKHAFGKRAKQFTSGLVFGKVVKVNVSGRDRYGRILGAVTLQGGRNLNRELVKAGYAWWYRQYARNDKTLAKLWAWESSG